MSAYVGLTTLRIVSLAVPCLHASLTIPAYSCVNAAGFWRTRSEHVIATWMKKHDTLAHGIHNLHPGDAEWLSTTREPMQQTDRVMNCVTGGGKVEQRDEERILHSVARQRQDVVTTLNRCTS